MEGLGTQATEGELTWVYCLKHPHSGQVCYVGVAIDPWSRFREHMRDALHGTNQKATWMRSLVPELPSMAVLEQVPRAEVLKAEKRWILKFRREGHPLTNSTMIDMAEESRRKDPRGRNPFEGLLTVEEVATRKEVERSAVVKAVNRGKLPAWLEKGQYWIREADLEVWQPVRGRGRRKREKPNA